MQCNKGELLENIQFGIWDPVTGEWEHNELLSISKEDQHAHNVKAGYSCQCGFKSSMCKRGVGECRSASRSMAYMKYLGVGGML